MSASERVLVTGVTGQLGRALFDSLPPQVEWLAAPGRLDITDQAAVLKTTRELKPSLIINAAAYTAVDKAETDKTSAFKTNRDGAANMANAAKEVGAKLVQVSTDFIFNGRKGTPYIPSDTPDPLSVYGESKLEGERAIQSVLGDAALIVRTAWVHYPGGNNFVRTMLRVMRERPEVRVVADQIGSPTHAGVLAKALWDLAAKGAAGVYHWTDAGVASWYDFAQAIQVLAIKNRPDATWGRVVPIATQAYPTPAHRPSYSVLDKAAAWDLIGIAPHWRESLEKEISTYLQG